jgi:hydroxymethylpyrimidine pyrophosphatase-like HAD family hydrolase
MRYSAVAFDFDETLAHDAVVAESTLDALRALRGAGRKLLLVTGREVKDLQRIFSHLDLFERVVAENGGVLHRPANGSAQPLAPAPPQALIELLRQKGVLPLSVGHVILATCEPHEKAVLEAIHELAIEYHIVFNKGAVMVLPSNVNKATGLKAASKELEIPHQNVAGIGDAENDHVFLDFCGFSAAVANAVPSLKTHVHLVTRGPRGAGVVELIEYVLSQAGETLLEPTGA